MNEGISGLIIKSPWIGVILSGEKTWEIRGSQTQKRGWIALIKSGSKEIYGLCRIIDVIGPLTSKELQETFEKHRIPPDEIKNDGLPYANTYAWVFRDALQFDVPIPYKHPVGAITWVNLPLDTRIDEAIHEAETIAYLSPKDDLRIEFLESLALDLQFIGHEALLRSSEKSLDFLFSPLDIPSLPLEETRKIYKALRNRSLVSELEFQKEMEERDILDMFIDGKDLAIDSIKPEIRICRTKKEKNIYRYCRNLQSVPTSSGVGRRLYALIYDVGQSKEKLMGVIGLASASYSLWDRDNFLEWNFIDSRTEAKRVKDYGLRRIMQLAVCMAIPPYNYLRCGKLIALLAFSDPVQEEFQQKYNQPLLGLQSTSAMRLHAAIFNRIHPNRLSHNSLYDTYTNELFARVGEVPSHTTIMISDETLDKARELVSHYSIRRKVTDKDIRKSLSKKQLIVISLRICGIKQDVLYMNDRGLYFGYLHENNKNILKTGGNISISPIVDLDVEMAIEYWKKNLLVKADIDSISSFSKEMIILSKQVETFIRENEGYGNSKQG